MATINKREVVQDLVNGLRLEGGRQPVITEAEEKLRAVYSVNPEKKIKVSTGLASDSASNTILTTSTIKDTYVIGIVISTAKDVNSDSLFSTITAQLDESAAAPLIRLQYEPVTAGNESLTFSFLKPLKIKRGTSITVTNSTATASIDTIGTVYYYEEEL